MLHDFQHSHTETLQHKRFWHADSVAAGCATPIQLSMDSIFACMLDGRTMCMCTSDRDINEQSGKCEDDLQWWQGRVQQLGSRLG